MLVRLYNNYRDKILSYDGKFVLLLGTIVAFSALDVFATSAYLLWSVFFGAFAASLLYVMIFNIFSLKVRRNLSRVAAVDVDFSYSIRVKNETGRTLTDLHVREEWLPDPVHHPGGERTVAFIDRIEPGAWGRACVKLRFEKRGVYTLSAIRAERFCPFGLMRSGCSLPVSDQVIVYPPCFSVREVRLSAANVHQPGGVPMASSIGESTEFVGLREYRSGDDVRRISWKAWSRLGRPVVREYQSEYFKRVALLMDTHVTSSSRREYLDFEDAVTTCASLARYFEENEFIIDIFAAGARLYYLQAGRGLGRLENVLELLSMVAPSGGEPFPVLDEALREVLGRLSALVIVTTNWTGRHRRFVDSLRGCVPQIKPVVVTRMPAVPNPARDIDDPGLARVVDASRLREEFAVGL